MLQRQRAELKSEADDLAHREARLRPQEDELKGRKVTLDVRERDMADQLKHISMKVKMIEVSLGWWHMSVCEVSVHCVEWTVALYMSYM